MKSYEVLRRAFKKKGCKAVADELNLSHSLILQWSRGQNGQSEALNPLDRVAVLTQVTGDESLLDWLCAQRGGRFVRESEMPSLLRRWVDQIKAELEWLMPARIQSRKPGEESGGSRCRYRLAGGRCGNPHARI